MRPSPCMIRATVSALLLAGTLTALAPGGGAQSQSATGSSGRSPITEPQGPLPSPVIRQIPSLTDQPTLQITGRVRAGRGLSQVTPSWMVVIDTPLGSFETPVLGRSFTADVPLALNTVNHLYFTTAAGAERSATVAVSVTHDTEAPTTFIDHPLHNAQVTTSTTNIVGRVGDRLSGFMGLTVTVNGIVAEVDVGIGNNGTFFAQGVPLAPGQPTTITAIATDKLGNSASNEIRIYQTTPTGPRMDVASGDGQTAAVGAQLTLPIAVQVRQVDLTPLANKVVTFRVDRSDGLLSPDGVVPGERILQVHTDGAGMAAARWIMGSEAGCGNNRVVVSSTSISGTTVFYASAGAGLPTQINVGSGQGLVGEAGALGTEPLRVWVSDSCNGVAGVPVTFRVLQGDGRVNGVTSVIVLTGVTGHAEVPYTFGSAGGTEIIEADFPANPTPAVRFAVRGMVRTPEQGTSFAGLVVDNSGLPIGGAVCILVVNGASQQTATGPEGRFAFDDLSGSGPGGLSVDGGMATLLGGVAIPPSSFPSLHFETVIVPDAANALARAVRLPALNPNNVRLYSQTVDTRLTVEGLEGLEMTIKGGSMRLNGIPVAEGTPVYLNTLQFEDMPMPMPDGAAPQFAWTLQPSGATFDPPVAIRYPNTAGLPPGAIANFLSFDHGAGRFAIVASGSVTEDGLSVVTDPNVGISTAGWGGACPPYSVTSEVSGCVIQGPAVMTVGDTITLAIHADVPDLTVPIDGFTWTRLSGVAGHIVGPTNTLEVQVLATAPGLVTFGTLVDYTHLNFLPGSELSCLSGHTVQVLPSGTAATFSPAAGLAYGYDDDRSPADEDYVSLNSAVGSSTQVVVDVSGFMPATFWAVSSDPTKVTIGSLESLELSGASTVLTLESAGPGGEHRRATIDIRFGDPVTGTILKSLNVELYPLQSIANLNYFRIHDPAVPGSVPPQNPTFTELQAGINTILKQAVVDVQQVSGDTDRQIAYDLNGNGALDFYQAPVGNGIWHERAFSPWSGTDTSGLAQYASPEMDVVEQAMLSTGQINVVHVKAVRLNWELQSPVSAADQVIQLSHPFSYGIGSPLRVATFHELDPIPMTLGLTLSTGESIIVVHTERTDYTLILDLQTGLAFDHALGEMASIAATGNLSFSRSSGSLRFGVIPDPPGNVALLATRVIADELGLLGAALQPGNIMDTNYGAWPTSQLLRYRPTPVIDGFHQLFQEQWTTTHRDQ